VTARISHRLRRQTIAGDAARIYVLQFGSLGLGLLTGIVVARALGPSGKGQLDLFLVITSFLTQFALLGADAGLLRRLTSKRASLAEVHGTGLVIAWGLGLPALLVGALGLPVWRDLVPGLPDWAILLAFAMTPVLVYRVIFSSLVIGINRAPAGFLLDAIMGALTLITIVALWRLNRLTPHNVIVTVAAGLVVDSVLAVSILLRHERRLSPRLAVARAALNSGFLIYVGGLANIAHFRIDQLLVNGALGVSQLGIYTVSVRWAEMLFFLDTAISSAALYRVASEEPAQSWALTKRLAFVQLRITAGAGILLAAVSPLLFHLLYGERFAAAAVPLVLLLPGVAAWASVKLISNMLTYNLGRAGLVALASIAGLVVNAGLNVIGLYVLGTGLPGVAVASSASYLFVIAAIGLVTRGLIRGWSAGNAPGTDQHVG
jgi:O-antigen/teichoic acid export membrane protein